MAASTESNQPSLVARADPVDNAENTNDPFLSKPGPGGHHRYSHFDTQLFSLGPSASPEQVRRALEAHLAETERRIQDASKLGTTLVQQRKELAERLKEVGKQQNEGDITPELQQKLVEIEKEYNEVGRESARAFLPKSRVSSNEIGSGASFIGDSMVWYYVDGLGILLILVLHSVPQALLNSRAKLPIHHRSSLYQIASNEINHPTESMTSNS